MSTTVTRLGKGSLRIGQWTVAPARDPQAWKALVGQKPTDVRFTLLPPPKRRWREFGAGALLQCLLAALLITVPMLFPQKLIPIMRYDVVHLLAPRTEVPLPPPAPVVHPKLRQPPPQPVEPPRLAKIFAPPHPLVPKTQPKNIPPPVAPKLDPVFTAAKIEGPKSEPARPRPSVETGVLNTGSAAPATVNKPAQQVQTGGFGDPEGVRGPGNPSKRANIARAGSFDLPPGPGYGNGTGGANGVRGTVVSAGFGNGVAIPTNTGGKRGTVQPSGFSEASVVVEAPKRRSAAPLTSPTQPVEILAKPNPVYSAEARQLKLEGEVQVEVVFTAAGEVRILRMTRGLGHGLDESAVRAAQQIRFKPAQRDGQPVDFPATVRITFQLAY